MRKILSIGLVRGLIGQVIGSLVGYGLLTGIRMLMGLKYSLEPAMVFGGLLGAIGFVIAVGVLKDWWKMAMGEEVPEADEVEGPKGVIRYFGVSYDHKVIGVQYLFLSLFLLSLGGTFALIFRVELAQAGMQLLTLIQFNTLVGLHGIILIASILLGVAGLMNYLVPLMIGANDMAFPRLNSFGFWVAVPGGLLVVSSMFFGGFETGWTGYPPLSVRGPMGIQMFFLGVILNGWSSILGGLNIIATVVRMRTKGMNYFRMPIFVWASTATSLIMLTGTQLIGLSFMLVMFERLLGMGFFTPSNGGNPILFQHLFWFYSHPAVYIFVLPGLGLISELLPVFVRKPLFGYKWVALSSMGIALVGFLVWAHHMFAAGMEEYLRVPFMYSTLLVAVPTGIKFFSWVATLWQGKMRFDTPMLFILSAVFVFLIGGITGPPNGIVATDLLLNNTYYIVGHFHATMFGGYIFPLFAAIYYWYPKVIGRKMNETLGRIQVAMLLPGFLITSFGQMLVGLIGMRRRVADYDPSMGFGPYHIVITIGGFMVAFSVIVFFVNLFRSAKVGVPATGNVWNSRSPEWKLLPTPSPVHNYVTPFVVVGDPYDYGMPGEYVVMPSEMPAGQPEEVPARAPATGAPANA
jgi:cytochrome c oxidase subunit I